jgi:glycosyltransferase involved in cell wall biosynthesis
MPMATLEFKASHTPFFAAVGLAARHDRRSDGSPRPRLAVISTYSDFCGIAAYTRALEKQLGDIYEVTIFDLDQYLLRSTHRRVRRFGDHHIRDICRELQKFDAVNLQLEYGTLGYGCRAIYRRFRWIVRAAPRISVTFHTVFLADGFDYLSCLKELFRFDFPKAIELSRSYYRSHLLSAGIARQLRRAQRFKPVSVIVHTRHDRANMKYVHGLRQVYDHPLSFLGKADAETVCRGASRCQFAVLDQVPGDAKLIGVFGFFGRYKGFETVARALHHLPKEYHLLIFGGVHPNEIKPHQPIDPVVSALFEAGYIDTNIAERVASRPGSGAPAVSIAVEGAACDLLIGHPKDLSERMHFLGAMPDDEFLSGMAICDAVVFPYLEVGQSASGPISQALELGCRIIASRTRTFLQFARYHPRMIEFFDIGNHLELAARLLARPEFDPQKRRPSFNSATSRATYLAANGGRRTPTPARRAQPAAAKPAVPGR